MEKLINATHHTIAVTELKVVELFFEEKVGKTIGEKEYSLIGHSGSYVPWNDESGMPNFTCVIQRHKNSFRATLNIGKRKHKLSFYSKPCFASILIEQGIRGILLFDRGYLDITVYEGNLLPGKFVNSMSSYDAEYCAFEEKSNKRLVCINPNSVLF